MASASSLLGLVNQLQSLESSFAAILMEAAMKLANLTDANIFFLVETPQGRKFSGKRHLCDLYVGGELAPVGSDVEFEIDPSISAIHERIVLGGFEAEAFEAEAFEADADYSSPAAASVAASAAAAFNDESFPRLEGSNWRNPFAAGTTTPHSGTPATSRKSKRPVSSVNGAATPSKRFKAISFKTEPLSDDKSFLDASIDESGAVVADASSGSRPTGGGGGGGGASAANGVGPASGISQLNGDLFETGGEYDVASFALSRMPESKLTAFAGIVDPAVYVKHSTENRLAVSVCYDFGKVLAELRPPHFSEEEGKAFLKANFDRWILQYDNLRSYLDVMIPNGNPEKGVQFSFMGMLRKAARSGYGCSKKNWNRTLPPGQTASCLNIRE